MKILPYKNDFRIQKKNIFNWTSNKHKAEKFEPNTSDRETMLTTLIISFTFSSSMSNSNEFCLPNRIVFWKNTLCIINAKNTK